MKKMTLYAQLCFVGALALGLAGCGGSNSYSAGGTSNDMSSASVDSSMSSSTASSSSMATGMINLSVTDGPGDSFTHVWVTITSVAFHTDPNQQWNRADATWQTTTLTTPVTLDLAALNNGELKKVFDKIPLPVGSYKQIRLFFASADDPLTASAQTNTPALTWNDQVEYIDANNVTQEAALDIAYPLQGIQLNGSFNITANNTLNIAVDFDLSRDVVSYTHDGSIAFALRPNLHYFDLDKSGAIVGKVNPSQLCVNSIATNCAYSLFVKAEIPTTDGTRHYAARTTRVRADGSFILYPLDVHDTQGNLLNYDVLIRGRNMDTLIVQQVPVNAVPSLLAGPTELQNTPIALTLNTDEYGTQLNAPLQPLTNGWVIFQQTLPSSALPYEVRYGTTDPFTGLLFAPIGLAKGPLHVATYNAGAALSFSDVQPVEQGGGAGSYSVATNALNFYSLSANVLVQPPATGSLQTFAAPSPVLNANIENGNVSGSITVNSNSRAYDHAQIILVHAANIVTVTDASNLLQNGGAFTLTNVPAGSAAHKLDDGIYYAYLRVWKAGSRLRPRVTPFATAIDLTTTNAVTGLVLTLNY